MAKTVPLSIIRAVMTKHGGPPFSFQQEEAASQTFAVGAILAFDGSGNMVEVVTDIAAYGVAHGTDVFPPNVRATQQANSVWLGDPSTIFCANLVNGINENVPGDHVLVQADLGQVYGFVFNTADKQVYLDVNSSSTNLLAFVHRPAGGAEGELGDTNARVLFTFLAQSLQDWTLFSRQT